MKIVNFGSCNIDYVYKLDHIVKSGETEQSAGVELFPGGKGLNQSIAAAGAGVKIFHAGCIGKDGQMLTSILRDSGVDTSFLQTVDAPCGHAVIQVDAGGENAIFIHQGANGCFSASYIDSVLSHFSAGDMVLLQNEINNMDYIIDRAYEKGMRILLNPSPIDDKIRKADFHKIFAVVLNRIEGEALSGQNNPMGILSFFQKSYPALKTVLTLGDQGCLYFDGKRVLCQPAFTVQVSDSTAAGDTFTGYFAACLAEGLPSEKILKTACAAAAIAVSKKGAAPSIPKAFEVERAFETLPMKKTDALKKNILKEQIDGYIERCIQKADLPGLAGELGYAPAYAGQVVKKTVGVSFSKYLLEKRCRMAAELLAGTDLSVEEVIEQAGYSNQSHFRKAFAELYDMSPIAYKKMMRGQTNPKGKEKK